MNNNNTKINSLKQEIDNLTLEQKTALMSDLLNSMGLQVVMGGGNFISAEVVLQIQHGSPESLAYIFEALARRVAAEDGKRTNEK